MQDTKRWQFVLVGIAAIFAFLISLLTISSYLGGGLAGILGSVLLATALALVLYRLFPYFYGANKYPTKTTETPIEPPVETTPEVSEKAPQPEQQIQRETQVSPESSSKKEICRHGPYRVDPGQTRKILLNVKKGDRITGILIEREKRDFEWHIVDELNLQRWYEEDFKRFHSVRGGEGDVAPRVRWNVGKDGPWYLLLTLYGKSVERIIDVHLNSE